MNEMYTEEINFNCPICKGALLKMTQSFHVEDDNSEITFYCECENGHKSRFHLITTDCGTGGWFEYIDPENREYKLYLESDEWKQKSLAAKIRAGNRCQLCNKPGRLHTHHRTYENLGHELEGDLIVLCSSCHAKFHNKEG